jgi:glycosyl-4,4'-diaponeurosporenoate acyltransferase
MLPDGAPWLGGFAKKNLQQRDALYLAQFLSETRRSELAHWSMLCCLPAFFLWNPPWACCVMTAYALAANFPCILAQRYNRIVLDRVLRSRCRTPERL